MKFIAHGRPHMTAAIRTTPVLLVGQPSLAVAFLPGLILALRPAR